MITYYLIKKNFFKKGFEPLLVYPMALDFFIIAIPITILILKFK
jgi:hypothetical protein